MWVTGYDVGFGTRLPKLASGPRGGGDLNPLPRPPRVPGCDSDGCGSGSPRPLSSPGGQTPTRRAGENTRTRTGLAFGDFTPTLEPRGRGSRGAPHPPSPGLATVGGQRRDHVAQELDQRGLQGRAEVPGEVPGEGHQQAVGQELRREGSSHPGSVRPRRVPAGSSDPAPARGLTWKLAGSTRSSRTCRWRRADRARGRSSRCSRARVSASATFWPWALTWAEPRLRSRWRK